MFDEETDAATAASALLKQVSAAEIADRNVAEAHIGKGWFKWKFYYMQCKGYCRTEKES